jgi:DNA-binding response OmpR family regulator
VLFQRWLLDREAGLHPAPSTAALVLDLKRAYLELRPVLRRVYAPLLDKSALGTYAPLGFTACEGGLMVSDFGPASVDGWLSDLAAREMLVDDDLLLDPTRRQLLLDGSRVDLTRLEFDVLHYLHERDGRNVDRASLLRDVWGYDWSGGSNVVEVVVSALRRKLGPHAASLQTVRGAGYRFTAPR